MLSSNTLITSLCPAPSPGWLRWRQAGQSTGYALHDNAAPTGPASGCSASLLCLALIPNKRIALFKTTKDKAYLSSVKFQGSWLPSSPEKQVTTAGNTSTPSLQWQQAHSFWLPPNHCKHKACTSAEGAWPPPAKPLQLSSQLNTASQLKIFML